MRTEPVTALKRKTTEILAAVEAYLVNVETYEHQQKRLTLLEGIACGEKAAEDDQVLTNAKAKMRMARWLKQSGRSPLATTFMLSPIGRTTLPNDLSQEWRHHLHPLRDLWRMPVS